MTSYRFSKFPACYKSFELTPIQKHTVSVLYPICPFRLQLEKDRLINLVESICCLSERLQPTRTGYLQGTKDI